MIDRFDNDSIFPKNNHNGTPPPFRGGNIKGIINRLDYITDLGVNSILLSPFLSQMLIMVIIALQTETK